MSPPRRTWSYKPLFAYVRTDLLDLRRDSLSVLRAADLAYPDPSQ